MYQNIQQALWVDTAFNRGVFKSRGVQFCEGQGLRVGAGQCQREGHWVFFHDMHFFLNISDLKKKILIQLLH